MRAFELTLPRNIEVYVDMDGVLADLYNHIGGIHDVEHYDHMTPAQWDHFYQNNDAYHLFRDIPAFPTTNKLLKMVVDLVGGYKILSSPLNFDREGSIKGKREWLKKHITVPADDVIFEHEKYKYATTNGVPNILIDDSESQLSKWRDAGGIAIKYQADKDTLQKVYQELKAASESTVEEGRKRKHKTAKRRKNALWGPGPYGGYGYATGYSGDGGGAPAGDAGGGE